MSQNVSLYKIMLSYFHKSIAIACHLNNKHVYICDNMFTYTLDTFIHSFIQNKGTYNKCNGPKMGINTNQRMALVYGQ
jgi:hypothetical protein